MRGDEITNPTTINDRGMEDVMENTNGEGLLEAEKRLQREEEQYELYDRIYIG